LVALNSRRISTVTAPWAATDTQTMLVESHTRIPQGFLPVSIHSDVMTPASWSELAMRQPRR
jgi:hypothetical protein